MILDYDEATLRNHMESRGIDPEVIDQKIWNFKMKTLPSAKYFDEQKLLHLVKHYDVYKQSVFLLASINLPKF